MTGGVLDSLAVIAMLDGEPGGARVRELIAGGSTRMSSVNLGEVHYMVMCKHGERVATDRVEAIRRVVDVDDPDWPLVRAAATIKAAGGLSYADAFCVATAQRHGLPAVTSDPEIVALAGEGLEVVDLRAG